MSRHISLSLTIVCLVALVVGVFSYLPMPANGEVQASIWTDKPQYAPEETATIFGSGFLVNASVSVEVTRPDSTVQGWAVDSDAAGSFTTTYLLDGINGTYTVFATDGVSNATTTFADPPKVLAVLVNPTSDTVSLGGIADYNVTVVGASVSNFNASLTFIQTSGPISIPSGLVSFNPAAVTCSIGPCQNSELTIATGSLVPGNYTFKVKAARVPSDSATSGTVHLTINRADTITITLIQDENHTIVTGPVPLGTSVHDVALVGIQVDGHPITGNVTYAAYLNGNCSGTPLGSVTIPVGQETPSTGPLAAGDYSIKATYSGDSNYKPSVAACEHFKVNKASTTTTTQVHDPSHTDITGHYVYQGTLVHDSATVGTQVDGFTISGNVTYHLYTGSLTCIGTPTNETVKVGSEPSAKNLTYGLYSYQAQYNGDSNYLGSISSCEPFTVLPKIAVTDSGLSQFDRDTSKAGQQFVLTLLQDPSNPSVYRLVSSNPGQFYDNVFYIGAPGTNVTLNISIPYPFVTQGAVPIQVASNASISSSGSFVPSNLVTSLFTITAGSGSLTPSGSQQILLSDYGVSPTIGTSSPPAPGSSVSVTVTGQVPSTGLIYVFIHLDYGLKGTTAWSKGAVIGGTITPASATDAFCNSGITSNFKLCSTVAPAGLDIPGTAPNLAAYTFGANGSGGYNASVTIQSENNFKRDPGFAGSVIDANGNPVSGVVVQIYGSTGKLIASVTTDENGVYSYQYKYTGSKATFTVKLPTYNLSQSIVVKSNSMVEVDFQLL